MKSRGRWHCDCYIAMSGLKLGCSRSIKSPIKVDIASFCIEAQIRTLWYNYLQIYRIWYICCNVVCVLANTLLNIIRIARKAIPTYRLENYFVIRFTLNNRYIAIRIVDHDGRLPWDNSIVDRFSHSLFLVKRIATKIRAVTKTVAETPSSTHQANNN